MPISRMQQPRQMYGLGSFVKKAVKGVTNAVKSVAKSPVGLAALIGGGAGLMGYGPFKGLAGTTAGQFLGRAKPFLLGTGAMYDDNTGTPGLLKTLGLSTSGFGSFDISNLGKVAAVVAPSVVGGMFTAKEQKDIEGLKKSGDQGLLKAYLERYYKNLNPDADDETVASFVRANAAYGGRMRFADGTEEFLTMQQAAERDPAMFRDTTTSAYGDAGEGRPVPEFLKEQKSLKENLQFLNEIKGSVSPKTTTYTLKEYLDNALKTGEISQEQYERMLMPFFGQQGEKVTEQIKEYENFANGGRIGYAFGNQPEQNAIQASGIGGLPLNQNPAGITELDLRDNGGFIPPVGVKEKADDIPAMLSNNEFVFTADAVRGMGEGDVNVGAQRMYDMMKKLENGGRV